MNRQNARNLTLACQGQEQFLSSVRSAEYNGVEFRPEYSGTAIESPRAERGREVRCAASSLTRSEGPYDSLLSFRVVLPAVIDSRAEHRHLHDDELALYLCREGLTATEVIKVREHLHSCQTCGTELEEVKLILIAIRNPIRRRDTPVAAHLSRLTRCPTDHRNCHGAVS